MSNCIEDVRGDTTSAERHEILIPFLPTAVIEHMCRLYTDLKQGGRKKSSQSSRCGVSIVTDVR